MKILTILAMVFLITGCGIQNLEIYEEKMARCIEQKGEPIPRVNSFGVLLAVDCKKHNIIFKDY